MDFLNLIGFGFLVLNLNVFIVSSLINDWDTRTNFKMYRIAPALYD